MNWKKIHDTGLRGAFCAVWVFAALTSFLDWVVALNSDYDSPEKVFYTHQGIVSGIVFCVGALAHSYLLVKDDKGDKKEDDEPFY